MNNVYYLAKLSKLLKVGIFCEDEGQLDYFCDHPEYNPIYMCEQLRKKLISGAQMQDIPYIFRDEYMVYFVCIKQNEKYFMAGPMSINQLSRIELFHFYKSYGMQSENERKLRYFPFAEVLDITELLENLLCNREQEDKSLIYTNNLIEDTKNQETREQVIFELHESEEKMYHHTYQEERKLLACVREGRVQDALHYTRSMDVDLGKLSQKEINHWKNAAIVGITLCTRAAIEGGISPSVAYRLSDYYIQKCDDCVNVEQLLEYRNHAVEELTFRINERLTKQKTSSYIERCKDYVNQHYREKIYLEDIAEALGISRSYLSRIFQKEMGIQLQDYIMQTRLEHAANLLIYSEESIASIAEYVHFPSQSYMGKLFKKYKNMTPREYRDRNKPREFSS